MIEILVCSILMRIKGGGHGFIRNKIKNKTLHRLLDGKILSTLGFGILVFTIDPWLAIPGALGWLAGVSPSIGEDIAELRKNNWKPALIRGVFLGAMLSLTLWNPLFILIGPFFPLSYWLSDKIDPTDWKYAEYILGAIIGVFLCL